MEVAGEVQVDVFHGDDLGVAAAGSATLDAEHGPEARLTQGDDDLLAKTVQGVGQADGRGGLALAGRGGVDGGHQDELTGLVALLAQEVVVDLGLGAAVALKVLIVDAEAGRNLADLLGGDGLGNLDVAKHARSSPI